MERRDGTPKGARVPNREISRRELLKSIRSGGLIVTGVVLAAVSGIDLYFAYSGPGDAYRPENMQRKKRDVWGGLTGVALTALGWMNGKG